MGSSTILDILGSLIVGGMLLLMGLRLNASANETTAIYHGSYILQENMTALVQILETDFRRIGYCSDWRKTADPTRSIRLADSTSIRFYTDLNHDGELDSVTYYTGPVSELLETVNPRDRFIYRRVNMEPPLKMNLGVTQMAFRYFDALNVELPTPVSDPRRVYYLHISIAVESPEPYKQEYSNDPSQYEVYWKQVRLATKNLRNR
ncbi:MAG: hypothetical protein FJ215_02555 [Ignavibacteria bacterium]|nr:hypothetical protein [Ignavibacteria bacterium]